MKPVSATHWPDGLPCSREEFVKDWRERDAEFHTALLRTVLGSNKAVDVACAALIVSDEYKALIESLAKAEQAALQAQRREKAEKASLARMAARADALLEALHFGPITDDIEPSHPDFDAAAFDAVMSWDRMGNAVLFGPPGCGKTRTLFALAMKISGERDEEIVWSSGREFAELVSARGGEGRIEANRRLEELQRADWLFLDDVGSAHFTEARVSAFFDLVDARSQLPEVHTVLTTNLGIAGFRRLFSGKGGDKVMADRILRRIFGTAAEPLARFFPFKTPDPRKGLA